jgi:hypothetical protein
MLPAAAAVKVYDTEDDCGWKHGGPTEELQPLEMSCVPSSSLRMMPTGADLFLDVYAVAKIVIVPSAPVEGGFGGGT